MMKVNSVVFSGDCSTIISEEDMHSDNSEVLAMFGEFQAGVDMVELDEGHMVLDGYSCQAMEDNDPNKPHNFVLDGYSKEESDLLNLVVDDQIDNALYTAAQAMGRLTPETAAGNVLFDDSPVPHEGPDYERALTEAISVFDKYFEVSIELDKAVDLTGWNALRTRRQTWWSHFQEEMDTNWLRLSVFERKADRQLYLLAKDGKEPTPEQWDRFMKSRKNIMNACLNMQNQRYEFTSSIYRKCQQVTTEARTFWKTPAGEEINRLRNVRSNLYKELNQPVLLLDGSTIIPWELVTSYWQLREEEMSPYFTSGDTSSVDDPEIVMEHKSQIESLMDTHLLEESQIEKSDTYWMNWYDTWLTKRIERHFDNNENADLNFQSLVTECRNEFEVEA